MKKQNLFYLTFILTILIIRLLVFLIPNIDITLGNLIIHHFWLGIILLLISLFIKNLYLKSIGLGLLMDQLVFMILGAGTDAEYWALPSILGTIILVIVFYFIKGKIIKCYYRE